MPALRSPRFLTPLGVALSLWTQPLTAQEGGEEWLRRCRDGHRSRPVSHQVHCEVRQSTVGARDRLVVDGRANGGVAVHGWDRNEIRIEARVQARAATDQAARELARRVRVSTSGSTIEAEGPSTGRDESWSVNYVIHAPRSTDLSVTTNNGPISVSHVRGEMTLAANNGPLTLRSVGGAVRGRTRNGPLTVQLEGTRWSGRGLDLETTNGPINLTLPANYSAKLETGTVNGPMNIDFPVTLRGRIGRRIETELGGGGPPIRVITTNGPVNVRRS